MPANPVAVAKKKEQIHKAAIELFTTKGYHGTSIRHIAERAGMSIGNLYNHHKDKEALFTAIMEDLEAQYTAPGTPLDRAFSDFESLEDLEEIGKASGEMVELFADYIRLIYVDVVEFEGSHIRRLFAGMRERYESRFGERLRALEESGAVAGPDPIAGLMMSTISFFYYFNITKVFGVPEFFCPTEPETIETMARILKKGMMPR